ncbi:MAG: rod shape-determining protein MreD [Clostridia bacterium]|nr:rod shape-determining protein MreD [Clostridia bacterium]
MSMKFKSVLILAVIAFQLTVLPHFAPFGVVPNYTLIFVIAVCLISDGVESVIFSGVTGLLMDLFTGARIGLNILLYMYISIALIMVIDAVYNKRLRVVIPMCFVSSFIYELFFGVLSTLLRGATFYAEAVWKVVLPVALINTVIFIPVYIILSRLRFEKRKRGIKYERQI